MTKKELESMPIEELRKMNSMIRVVLERKVKEETTALEIGDIMQYRSHHLNLYGVVMYSNDAYDPEMDKYEEIAYSLLTYQVNDGKISDVDWLEIKNPEYLCTYWEKTGNHIDGAGLRSELEDKIQEIVEKYLK